MTAPDPSSGGRTESERERLAEFLWNEGYHPAMADDRAWSDLSNDDSLRRRFLRRADAILASPWLADRVAAALIAAGVVQTRAQVVAALAEDEALQRQVTQVVRVDSAASNVRFMLEFDNRWDAVVSIVLRALAAALAAPADTGGTA